MATIQDILKLNLNDDIKNVIDLEDFSQDEIQSEIETYIVTDGLGRHLSKFINEYTSNLKETGVWLSGFYGSGKSYFGKMLGYLLDNRIINGTTVRDRFIPRLEGVANQSLIENDIRKLDSIRSRVVFLDAAKQNTDNGFAFTLFENFLKSLGFRGDLYGYMEFELFLDGRSGFLASKSLEILGKEWPEVRKSQKDVARAMRRIFIAMDYTEAEFDDTKNTFSETIRNFSANKLKEELEKYLLKYTDETIVFIFDEASEAVSQRKFSLLDLEGISESLSSISKKVWTIAIAQEKLDDVINNANVNKSQLTKVTDRFKTKMHLESTEVDVIIRNRLLQKKEESFSALMKFFNDHGGQVSDATNLKSTFPTKTIDSNQFATYYPFHKYQFDLLQKFLFSSNALVASQIAARGMIITTFDVLRKQVKNKKLHSFATAHEICTEAQTSPPADLVNKYDNAKSILSNAGLVIDGEKLLKTIHFIVDAGLVSPTVENITKSYIHDISSYYDIKPSIENALQLLVDSKILLYSNNNYKITSNLEGKLLEEMRDYDVELFIKKRELVGYLKKLSIFRQVSIITDDTVPYNFNILTDLDDEIIASNNKNLKLIVYSLFNISEDRADFIEGIKIDTQFSKDMITLVPDNSNFGRIDRLLEEVKAYSYMEDKYSNDDDPLKRQIIREFSVIKQEKEKDLMTLIQEAYSKGTLIYLFNEDFLNADSFKGSVNEVQRKLIKNIYTKRLTKQLSEEIAPKLLKESQNDRLNRFFSGNDFKFFDSTGNFIGEHLKVVEEINDKIKNKYIDGRSLEEELSGVPWGYSFGTIITTLAVLFRAGRLVVRYNDTEYFSYSNSPVHEVFVSSIKFKSARFKSITKTLTTSQKNQIIQTMLDLDFEKYTGNKISWSASDFETADSVTQLAENFVSSLNTLKSTISDFEKLFINAADMKSVLQAYTSKTTESNYIQKAEDFLSKSKEYIDAVTAVIATEKFIIKNLDKLKGFRRFVEAVNNELSKAGIVNVMVEEQTRTFEKLVKSDVIKHFGDIQNTAQTIRDIYFNLMNSSAKEMTDLFSVLLVEVQNAQADLNNHYPAELNSGNIKKLNDLRVWCKSRILEKVNLEYHIICQDSKYSLTDILNYIALAPSKSTELELIKGNFVKVAPPPEDPATPKAPKKMHLNIGKKVMSVGEYRKILASQIQAMAGLSDEDKIELNLN